jgi:uncharacterized membrane protein
MKRFSIGEAVQFGWETWKSNALFWIGVVLVILVIDAVIQVPSTRADRQPALALVVSLIGILVHTVLQIGLTKMSLRFVDGGRGEFSDLYSGYPLFFNYLITSILLGLMVFIGFILLIVPGIILAVIFGFSTFAVVDRGMGPIEALQRSAAITSGVRMEIFLFGLVALGLNILGAILCGIGLLATYPTTMLAAAYIYRQLDRQTVDAPQLP